MAEVVFRVCQECMARCVAQMQAWEGMALPTLPGGTRWHETREPERCVFAPAPTGGIGDVARQALRRSQ